MAEILLVIVGIVVAVLAVIAIPVWACVALVRLLVRAVFGAGRHAGSRVSAAPGGVACQHPGCRAANVAHAQFCRRCGKAIGAGASAGPTRMRYVA